MLWNWKNSLRRRKLVKPTCFVCVGRTDLSVRDVKCLEVGPHSENAGFARPVVIKPPSSPPERFFRIHTNPCPCGFELFGMTRSNEVYRKWGAFLESKWIGHSRQVREDHYLAVTDEDFLIASEWTTPETKPLKKKVGRIPSN